MNSLALHAGNPGPMTGSGNWTYLLPGDAPVLVDAGVGQPRHLDAVFTHAPRGPALVLATHIHPDHASGAASLAAAAPSARFAKWPWPERDAGSGLAWESLADGQRVDTGEGPIEVVHTPGHSPDHVVFWHAESATAFTGDLLVLGGTVVIPASDGGSLRDYLSSLERIAALRPRRALPAHGPPIDDPLALIDHYQAHRRQRELQVLEALSAAPAVVADIVSRIYRGLDPALLPQAHDSVLAHLQKLASDGVVLVEGAAWRLR